MDDDAHRSQRGTESTVRRQVERRGPGNCSRGQHYRDAHGHRGTEQETQSSGDRAAFAASGFLDGRVKDGRLHGASRQEGGFQNSQTPAHNQRGDGHSFISRAGQGWRRAVQHGPSPWSAACNRRRLQAFCVGLWMSLNEGSHRPHFAESLPGHSVMRESDYVSPITARCLALQLELTCCLQAHGPSRDHFWHDARIDVDDRDLSVCCHCGDLADQPSPSGTGATGHMDSLPGIEPCLDVRSLKLETAPVAPCRLDLCTTIHLYSPELVHRPATGCTQRYCSSRTAPAPINTTGSLWGPLTYSDDPTEPQASVTVCPLVKGGSCRSFPVEASTVRPLGPFPVPCTVTDKAPIDHCPSHSAPRTPEATGAPMPVRSILLRGGSCRSSASRCMTWQHTPMRKRTHRVRFSFEVAFWFPAASQLSLTHPPPQGTAYPHQSERQPPNFLVVGRRKPKASLCGPAHSHVPDDDTSPPQAARYRLGGTALRNAAFTQVASCSSGPAEPALLPYSSFDSVTEHRTLQGQQDWPEWRYVIHAIKESVFPGNPLQRFMHHNVAGFPTPQVMVTPARRFEAVGSVVFDLRGLALGIEVIDITPGVSIAAALPGVRKLPSFPAVLNALRSRTLRCTVNDEPATAESVLQGCGSRGSCFLRQPRGTGV